MSTPVGRVLLANPDRAAFVLQQKAMKEKLQAVKDRLSPEEMETLKRYNEALKTLAADKQWDDAMRLLVRIDALLEGGPALGQDGPAPRDEPRTTTSEQTAKAKIPVKVTVVGLACDYDRGSHAATGTVVGEDGRDLGGPRLTYNGQAEAPTNAGTYTLVGEFDGDDTYAPGRSTDKVDVVIRAVKPTVTVAAVSVDYDGKPHAASGQVLGVGGENLGTPLITYAGKPDVPVNAGSYALAATFTPGEGQRNYTAAAAPGGSTVDIKAVKPTLALTVTDVDYDGKAHAATATVIGVLGENLGAAALTYNGKANVPQDGGSYAVVASFAAIKGNPNYLPTSVERQFTIRAIQQPLKVETGDKIAFGEALAKKHLRITGAQGELSYQPPLVTKAPAAGAWKIEVTAKGNKNYLPRTEPVTLQVDRAEQKLTWDARPKLTYGEPLGDQHLNVQAAEDAVRIYSNAKGEVINSNSKPPAGKHPIFVRVEETTNYKASDAPVPVGELVVERKADYTPPWPPATIEKYHRGLKLEDLVLSSMKSLKSGGTHSLVGRQPDEVPGTGTTTVQVKFTPGNPNYAELTNDVKLTLYTVDVFYVMKTVLGFENKGKYWWLSLEDVQIGGSARGCHMTIFKDNQTTPDLALHRTAVDWYKCLLPEHEGAFTGVHVSGEIGTGMLNNFGYYPKYGLKVANSYNFGVTGKAREKAENEIKSALKKRYDPARDDIKAKLTAHLKTYL